MGTWKKLAYYTDITGTNLANLSGVVTEFLNGLGAFSVPAGGAPTTELLASNNLRNSNDGEKSTNSTSYVKIKEVLLNADLGACRLKFDLKSSSAGTLAYAKVYKNAVAIGTEQSNSTTSYVTKSEDFSGFLSGDLIQIYAKAISPKIAYVQNMRFYYDKQITAFPPDTLVTPLLTTTDPTISMTNQDP